jgi:hypothetical protein
MELYNKLVAIITGWLDKLDASTLSTADGFTAFRLLAPRMVVNRPNHRMGHC